MNVDINSEKINSCRVIAEEKSVRVIEGDLIVPDIKPDILSLSSVDAEVYLLNKAVKDGVLTVEGAVDVCAIYVSEDATASLKSLNNVFNFRESIMIDELTEDSIVTVKLRKGPIEYKIINGRKLNVKVPVTIHVVATNNNEVLVARDIVDDRNVQTLKEKYTLNMMGCCKSQDIEISENVTLDDGAAPIGEILKATMQIENPEYKISYNKILVKADALVKIIYTADTDNVSVETFEKTLPVMGFVESEGIAQDADIKLNFEVKSFVIRPIYQDLKSMSFGVESEVVARVCTYQKNEIEILSDVYNPDMCLKCNYEKIPLNQNIISQSSMVEIVQEVPVQDLENVRVLNVSALTNNVNKTVLNEKLALEGNLEIDVLYFNRSKNTIENKKIDVPIAQNIKVEDLKANMNPDVELVVGNVTYMKTGSGNIEVRVPILVNVEVNKCEYINGINTIEISEESIPEISSITLYYVKEGDSLWKIAKKYCTTVEDIMKYNDLKDDKIFPNDQLLIPKRVRTRAIELL